MRCAQVPSPSNGMLFCQGCVTEMGPEGRGGGSVYDAIRRMAKYMVSTHFRNVSGTPRDFREVFVDEGQVDMIEAMRT